METVPASAKPAARSGKSPAWLAAHNLRLASGLVLFVYLASHLLNHAAGLVSLEAMEDGRAIFLALWRSLPGTVLLYGAFLVHLTLVIWSLLGRRTWRRIHIAEVTQIAFGLCIPPLLIYHIIVNRGLHTAFGLNDSYAWVVLSLWRFEPDQGILQTAVTILAWTHGCLGVHFWLRLKPWYPRAFPYVYSASLILPVMGLLGFVSGAREAVALYQNPMWRDLYMTKLNLAAGSEAAAWVYQVRDYFYLGMVLLTVLLLLGRIAYWIYEKRKAMVTLTYPMGRKVTILPGAETLLEASRHAGIPHASVCGGKGRCSTCRVRVNARLESLPPPSLTEARVLSRVGAPPGVRLACQIRPVADLSITPLIPPGAQPKQAYGRPAYVHGSEREIAILFADLRSFTAFSERKLPYDVVFVINQYFRLMGRAVEQAGGNLDKFIGDGVMALFGIDDGPEEGCRKALAAARGMAAALEELNDLLQHDLDEPLRIGIGIHCGPSIVGEMGYGQATSITAIGDAVNTASRLETVTKDYKAQLVFSETVGARAGIDLSQFETDQIMIRGRKEPLVIYVVKNAGDLPVGD